MKGNVAEMVQEPKKVSCQRRSRWVFTSTYKFRFFSFLEQAQEPEGFRRPKWAQMNGNVAEMVQEPKKDQLPATQSVGIYQSLYNDNLIEMSSSFVALQLKNKRVSEDAYYVIKAYWKCCKDGLGTKKRLVVSDIVGGFLLVIIMII